MRPSLAIVGTGIAGMGVAHFLHSFFDVSLFEQNDYPGGHTNTIDVPESGQTASFDTGFMVFNRVTYPNLCRLFDQLKVPVRPTSMSFSVQHRPSDIEFSGSSVNHLFSQRRNFFRPRFWFLLKNINRFNTEAAHALSPQGLLRVQSQSLGEYLAERRYSDDLRDLYLVPMASAVWSTPPGQMLDFPALTLLRFFHNHGFLGLHTQHPWWTVEGGAREYVRRLIPPFQNRIHLLSPVQRVQRSPTHVNVVLKNGDSHRFDRVVLACHADQALALLDSPTDTEHQHLSAFQYQPNLATVHTDARLMPRRRLAWSSWNYRIDASQSGEPVPQTLYWMNSLQGVSNQRQYFVSINGESTIRPDHILRKIPYRHPLFSKRAVEMQETLPSLNRQSPQQQVFFAGSYFKYGFHEDAFTSGLQCAEAILGRDPWTAS